uniref:Uncharacterized protein n=1 Tax=Alsidium seaforthii TaxID=2007182 RepID=A0A1Z1MDN3_9FLOR|nr:hypothetical protein [Bryothamnion seaforthii]ARW63925.1 hypothetical protein [Bryothamnion seaforthii]
MEFKFQTLRQSISGKWLSNTNIYFLDKKSQKASRKEVSIQTHNRMFVLDNSTLLKSDIVRVHFQPQETNKVSKILRKINLKSNKINSQLIAKLTLTSNASLKIAYFISEHNIIYEEYLYLINSNFIVSIGYLKNVDQKQYLSIIVSSYIRLS